MAAKVAIVTGAARGIGRAVVERLVTQGCAVVASDILEDVNRLADDTSGRVTPIQQDIAAAEGCREISSTSPTGHYGQLDILVNTPRSFCPSQ